MGFVLPAALVLLCVLSQLLSLPIPILGKGWAKLDESFWPVELIPEIRQNQFLRPQGSRIFNEYVYGGILIKEVPAVKVFIDDRCELFGDEFLREFVLTKSFLEHDLFEDATAQFQKWENEYGSFDLALVETDGGFDRVFQMVPFAWELIKRTDTATLYRRIEIIK